MNSAACYLPTDLGELHLFTQAGAAHWEPPAYSGADSVEAARARIVESARWLLTQLDSRDLPLVCFDIAEARCLWIRSPSTEQPVLAARLKSTGEDWGDLLMHGSAQALQESHVNGSVSGEAHPGFLARLNQPVGAAKNPSTPVGSAVLHMPDAIARLWLGELDRLGLRVGTVASLWHAVARAWGKYESPADATTTGPSEPHDSPTPQLTAVVAIDREGERLVWTWSLGCELLCAGASALASAGESATPSVTNEALERASNRLGLDWLAWAGNLTRTPDRIVIVGKQAELLGSFLRKRWADTPISLVDERNPIERTIERAQNAGSPASGSSTTQCLTQLTKRPTRAVRRRFRVGAATLALLAVGTTGFAWRLGEQARELAAGGTTMRQAADERALALNEPTIRTARDKAKALRALLATMQNEGKVDFPPPPRPIFKELSAALKAMKPFEDDGDLLRITIDSDRQTIIQYQITKLRPKTELKLAIENLRTDLIWNESKRATRNDVLQMEGAW